MPKFDRPPPPLLCDGWPTTTFEKIDDELAARGWRYDVDTEDFFVGNRRLDYRRVLALVPGMTLDELASYQEDKWDKAPVRLSIAQSLAGYVARNTGQAGVARSK